MSNTIQSLTDQVSLMGASEIVTEGTIAFLSAFSKGGIDLDYVSVADVPELNQIVVTYAGPKVTANLTVGWSMPS